jgi:hypothetical protein
MNLTSSRKRIAAGVTLSLAILAAITALPAQANQPVAGDDYPRGTVQREVVVAGDDYPRGTVQREIPYLSQGVGITRPAPTEPQTASEIPYLSQGVGVTRPVPSDTTVIGRGDSKPDGYQPVHYEPVVITETLASSSGFDWADASYGLGLGVGLALLAAAMVLVARNRAAHA